MSLLYSRSFNYQDEKNQQHLQNHNFLFTQTYGGAGINEPDDFRFFRSSSPETDAIMAGLDFRSNIGAGGVSDSVNLEKYREDRSEIKQEIEDSGKMGRQSLLVNNEMDSYGNSVNSFGLQQITKMKSVNGSNLLRHNSSPPEFFSEQGLQYGLNLPQIDELEDENPASTSLESNINAKRKYTNFDSWIDSSSNQFKRLRNTDEITFSTSNLLENQNGNCGSGLIHHHSLPKTASELATIEKFMKFQGSPCKIRAKRGFATHPRSIAERVRRTRISERMRKLQDLFPNIDKQTNTSDMLDKAVEYIKDLQKEVKNLADCKSKCRCSSSHELSNSNSSF